MELALPPKVVKLITDRIQSGMYRSAEDVVSAAVLQLDETEQLRDFAPGELDALIAEGEASGPPLDGDAVFAELKAKREARRAVSK